MPKMMKHPIKITLSDEQLAAVDQLLSFPSQIQTLGGYAGTGKSTVIQTLRQHLPGFMVCAFTGKAAHVLRSKGVPASTIHSLIYFPQEIGQRVIFERKEPDQIPGDGFIVDEASMVSSEIHEALLACDRPILYVGDHGQLPPVSSEGGFNLMESPDVTLETVHRNAGPIAHFADFIRKGNSPSAWVSAKAADDQMQRRQELQGECRVEFLRLCELERAPDQFICAFNQTRVTLNKACRELLDFPADRPVVGDRIMCLRNDRGLGLFNGMQGTVEDIEDDRIIFRSEGVDYPVRVDLGQFNRETAAFAAPESRNRLRHRLPFDYCYAVTCHKAQGDEWDSVAVLEERSRNWAHERWAYTAASRARKLLTWIVQ